jgi:flagellar motor protein MotB
MKSRVDVWPSLTDLFSALLLGTFGALMLSTGPPPRPCVDVESQEIRAQVRDRLQKHLGGDIREAADDVCIDVYLNFKLNEDEILSEYREKLQQACVALRDIFYDNPQWRNEVEIWIEGHTDSTPPQKADTPRDHYLFNWNLSSKRAASVLYEFSQCDVTATTHRIRAIGYADTQPLPRCGQVPNCEYNRRTTFRIRPDKAQIAERLKKEGTTRTDCEPPR